MGGGPDQCYFCCSGGGDGAGLGRMMVLRTVAATVKSQDGVGNDWFWRDKRAVGPFVTGFLRARIGSHIEETYTGKPKRKRAIYFPFRLAFAWQGLAGLDSSGKRQMKNDQKLQPMGRLTSVECA